MYIAHGYMLALNNVPLLNEKIYLSRFGPFIRNVHEEFRIFQNHPIKIKLRSDIKKTLSFDEKEIIHSVINLYGDQDVIELTNLTMQNDSPWFFIWKNKGKDDRDFVELDNDVIKNHFLRVVTETNNVHGL
jgi:uncharacterized phage-associated protein